MSNLDLGVVGNCSFSALINRQAQIVWCCMPRFDSDPIFCSLLQGKSPDSPESTFSIDLLDYSHSEQHYIPNTAILVTTLVDAHGNALEVVDFAPRFKQYGRTFRPIILVRRIHAIRGAPRIRIRLRPTHLNGLEPLQCFEGSNHISYLSGDRAVRLTTNASITAIKDERSFVLNRPLAMIFGPDEAPRESVAEVASSYFTKTLHYWRDWTRYLAIPFEWQDAVIRAAITLKISAFEDTGAIIAAPTTSIPEAPNSGRNWDYRYCWLRDAYFTVQALNRLGVTQTMERYLEFIVNIVASAQNGQLQPVYRVNGEEEMVEYIVDHLPGYRGMGPVRISRSSASRPRELRRARSSLKSSRASSRRPWAAIVSIYQKLQMVKAFSGSPKSSGITYRKIYRPRLRCFSICATVPIMRGSLGSIKPSSGRSNRLASISWPPKVDTKLLSSSFQPCSIILRWMSWAALSQ